jgi:pilus assembly protein FimV
MIRNGLARGLLALLMLPGAAFALGLGDIRLTSSLNAPLEAEIELVNATAEDLSSLQARVASKETFARYGLDWPSYLSSVTVARGRSADGREVLKIRSAESITEPFVTLLVEANWARGRLVREYTMLLDPPVFAPEQQRPAPVAAPSSSSSQVAGNIERPAVEPASGVDGDSYRVRRGDSLSTIARRLAGGAGTTTDQMMVGLYQGNAGAFEGDMNRLRAGAVLRIPSTDEIGAIAPAVASAEVRRQTGSWRPAAGASGSGSGRLRLVTPTEVSGEPAGGTTAVESEALRSRVKELEGQLSESQRLLELRNAELADLQSKLAAAGQPVTPPAQTPVEPPVAETPPATQPDPGMSTEPGTTEVPPASAADPAATPPAEQPPVAAQPEPMAPTATMEEPVAGPSIIDTLKGFWWILPALLVGLLALLGFKKFQARKSNDFDDRLGTLAEQNADALTNPLGDTARMRQPLDDDRILVEESGSRPALQTPLVEESPRSLRTDDTISSDTAINLDQGDPLAEADFHMAYGLYDQAADLVKIAIAREPERRDLKLKLLEVFFVWGNKEQFLTTAHELADAKGDAAPGEWEKILIMGKQIAPEDALFANASVGTGGAMGVDLNLDGGQNRVDFDPFDSASASPTVVAPAAGVDLDLGGALRDPDATGESLAATAFDMPLAGDGFDDKGSATTREMTAKVLAAGAAAAGATGMFEGSESPTVEQPALRSMDNPTIREKVEVALKRQPAVDQTAELAIDDLGLDLGALDQTDSPSLDDDLGLDTDANAPTMVAGLDARSRKMMADAAEKASRQQAATGAEGASGTWYLNDGDLNTDLSSTKTADTSPTASLQVLAMPDDDFDASATSRLASLDPKKVDFELSKTGSHTSNGLDLDVGAAPKTGGTQRTEQLRPEELALPDLEPVTLSEVGTKLDLARAYVDMGDPDGARNILQEVLNEGSNSQKQEAQRLLDSLPG